MWLDESAALHLRKREKVSGGVIREMELEHFSHDHPLILNEEHKDDGVEVSCYGCARPISGPIYGCTQCEFFLHKSCAELPSEITHPSHLEHPLTLLPNPPESDDGCLCDVCGEFCSRFTFHCPPCRFNIDVKCASTVQNIQQRIEHRCHNDHQLIPMEKPAMFLCDGCGTKHEGKSYLCSTCGFWVNQSCASLPSTIKLRNHHHPLTLCYSIPYEYYRLGPSCETCAAELKRIHWVYCCARCRHFVHVQCATSETEVSRDCKAEIKAHDLLSNLITLPLPDESVDLITLLNKYIRLHGKYIKEVTEISHVSHEHPLILSDKRIDDESYSGSNLPLLNEMQNDIVKCNGCTQTISSPFYHCAQAQCNFFLHQWCAELPNELRHPCHPHHLLLLIPRQPQECRCCGLYCHGFVFGCSICRFYLDIKCASLPLIVRHEAHKHTLALRQTWSGSCIACNDGCGLFTFAFVCDPCNLTLCIECALLPRTVRHRYDKHPFILTYAIVKDQRDEYYCDICEREINFKYWFYHCGNCDQSLHTTCIHPIEWYPNLKYGVTHNFGKNHHHLLTSVRSPMDKDNSSCGHCGFPFGYELLAFECATCNFWIHQYCTIVEKEIQ